MKSRNLMKTAFVIILSGLLLVSCKDSETNKEETPNKQPEIENIQSDTNNQSGDTDEVKEMPLVESITVTDFVPGDYYAIYSMSDGIFAALDQNFSMGLIDNKGTALTSFEYSTRRGIYDNVTAIRNNEGKWGFFNVKEKRFILECKYDEVLDFSEGIGCYFDGKFYQYIYADGTKAANGIFFQAAGFSDGLARVLTDDSLGYIDKTGKVVIYCDYPFFDDFHEGFARVHDGESYGYIDKDGKLKFKMNCSEIYSFNNGLAAFISDGRVGYIDKKGTIVIPPEYDAPNQKADEYFTFMCGVAPIMKDGKYGFINTKGEIVIEPEYDLVMYAMDDIIRVRKDNLFGYLRTDGTVITECIFEEAGVFSDGIAKVMKDDQYYFINKEGKELTTERFDDVTNFTGGTAYVVKPGTYTWYMVTAD